MATAVGFGYRVAVVDPAGGLLRGGTGRLALQGYASGLVGIAQDFGVSV